MYRSYGADARYLYAINLSPLRGEDHAIEGPDSNEIFYTLKSN